MKEKKVQVSERFYGAVVELLGTLEARYLTDKQHELCCIMAAEIEARAAAAARREKFTAYKTAAPGDERDAKRIDYLVEAGMGRSYRSAKEVRAEEPPV